MRSRGEIKDGTSKVNTPLIRGLISMDLTTKEVIITNIRHLDSTIPVTHRRGIIAMMSLLRGLKLVILIVSGCCLVAGSLSADDLFQASGRKLKASQRGFVEQRIKGLRDSDYLKRFQTVQYLIELDRIGLPFLLSEVKESSNPMLVRCAILALSEIGGNDAVALLNEVIRSSRSDRDERIIAALGLGKLDAFMDLETLT